MCIYVCGCVCIKQGIGLHEYLEPLGMAEAAIQGQDFLFKPQLCSEDLAANRTRTIWI